ncbi:transposase [Pseudoduganella violacea]|uniref:REP element-mobilizing transposase RayT n=1 Tax=Pseudoduganella violacea TaxID=1715466 RepID=A0A7W5BEK7_9BURK|nr:transposase [Pseudoduganella violacea]MBB3121480.1 REP element-mobilizing transposase RayT [Pseudoduganella violacea]
MEGIGPLYSVVMGRLARIEFPGALYHVTARGNRRSLIYLDERDYLIWQDLLAETVKRFHLLVHGFCQMPNHYHLLAETPDGNLSAGMHFLNGVYAKHFNARHELVGHVIQGRYHGELVHKQSHLLELARYISLNPVRAELVADPAEWRWSSHRAMLYPMSAPSWLSTTWLLSQFGSSEPEAAYRDFVQAGCSNGRPAAQSLDGYANDGRNRDAAVISAYQSGIFSMRELARHFGISTKTVSRLLRHHKI